MRYSSVAWTLVLPRKARRRLGLFVCIRCLRPALRRSTFPPAVILNRLAADFFVLMPLGRRISHQVSFKKSAQYSVAPRMQASGIFVGDAVPGCGRAALPALPCAGTRCAPGQRGTLRNALRHLRRAEDCPPYPEECFSFTGRGLRSNLVCND